MPSNMRAGTVVLPGESQDDFDELLASIQQLYEPQNVSERILVEQMAISNWKLARAQRIETRLFEEGQPAGAQIDFFDRLIQIQSRLEHASLKAYQELERIKRARHLQEAKQEEEEEEENRGRLPVRLSWVNSETGERTIVAESPGLPPWNQRGPHSNPPPT